MEKITALIADDHQLFREGMESLLKKIPGIEHVLHAANGLEAVNIVQSHDPEQPKPDLIFMDIRMPEMNGIEATRAITKSRVNPKIIALTMMEDPHHVVSMFKSGAHGYLLKNTSFKEVQQAIEAVMNGERYYSKHISANFPEHITGGVKNKWNSYMSVTLTTREKEIVGHICRGFSNKDIGELLDISIKTVETHRMNIYSKLGVNNSVDLAVYALQENLVTNWG